MIWIWHLLIKNHASFDYERHYRKKLELQNKKRILSDKLIDGEVRDRNILSELTEDILKIYWLMKIIIKRD